MNPIKPLLPGMFALGLACAVSLNVAMLVQAQEASPPVAPSAASKSGLSRVVVRTLVDSNGTVKATQIRESSGNSRLDEEALQVVSKVWSFSPLKINGKGIEVWVNVPINFVQADTPAAPPASAEPVPVLPVVPDPAPPAADQPKVVPEPAASTGQAKPAASEAAPVPAPPIAPAPASASAPAPASAPLPPAATPASAPVPVVSEAAASAAQVPASAATPAASAANAPN